MTDYIWGGLLFMVPSRTANKYLNSNRIIPEEDVPPGGHYRARKAMLENVRGYKEVKDGLKRRILQIEHDRRRARSEEPQISTSGVSPSKLGAGHEYWQPMDPIYYHEKSCCFRNTYTRCPLFKRKPYVGLTEPRREDVIGLVDVRRKLAKHLTDD